MAIITVKNRAISLDAAEIPNLDASKITTGTFDASKIGSGTFADARIAASNVSQHATSFDDNKIVNDISTLGLRVHTQENLNASNSNSASFDVFQDSSAISNLTNTARNDAEYVSSISGTALPTGTKFYLKGDQANGSTTFTDSSSSPKTINANGGVTHSDNAYKIGSTSIYQDGTGDYLSNNHDTDFRLGSAEFHMEMWYRAANTSNHTVWFSQGGWGTLTDYMGWSWRLNTDKTMRFDGSNGNSGTFDSWAITTRSNTLTLNNNTWYHVACSRGSDNKIRFFLDGVETTYSNTTGQTGTTVSTGSDRGWKIGSASDASNNSQNTMYYDNFLFASGSGSGKTSNFTPPTSHYGLVANATGSFTGNNITASSSTNKMGAVITYQDNAGTNALNTDIVLQLSADGGSNYSTATLTALPDFATGIKMAKVNDLSVTAGTSLKYKISFANQAQGSKEARIRGVSLQY